MYLRLFFLELHQKSKSIEIQKLVLRKISQLLKNPYHFPIKPSKVEKSQLYRFILSPEKILKLKIEALFLIIIIFYYLTLIM